MLGNLWDAFSSVPTGEHNRAAFTICTFLLKYTARGRDKEGVSHPEENVSTKTPVLQRSLLRGAETSYRSQEFWAAPYILQRLLTYVTGYSMKRNMTRLNILQTSKHNCALKLSLNLYNPQRLLTNVTGYSMKINMTRLNIFQTSYSSTL